MRCRIGRGRDRSFGWQRRRLGRILRLGSCGGVLDFVSESRRRWESYVVCGE